MRQSVKWEAWPCRTCAFVVVAFRLRTTVGGSLQGMSTATTGRGNNAIGCARLMVASVIGGLLTVLWSDKTLRDLRESEKFFEHTLHRKVCVIA